MRLFHEPNHEPQEPDTYLYAAIVILAVLVGVLLVYLYLVKTGQA